MLNNKSLVFQIFCFLVIFIFFISCARSKPQIASKITPTGLGDDTIKIGLLADSQIQTNKSSTWVPLISGKLEDVAIPVAIRPPALDYYSHYLLKYFLKQLVQKEVDVILYLGDGANNGCEDEIGTIFNILNAYRKNIPIFFVIGNHDYLGAGNTAYMPDRHILCDSSKPEKNLFYNRPLTKYDLISNIDQFNKESSEISADWKYSSNVLDNKDAIYNNCTQVLSKKTNKKNNHQHLKPGCFLSGIAYNEKLDLEILLIDTSDYYDKEITYNINPFKKGYFGLSGWVSTEGPKSQLNWLEDKIKQNQIFGKRIIASHYPLSDLAPFFRIVLPNTGLPCRLAPLYSSNTSTKTYWFSAHTHEKPKLNTNKISWWQCNKIGKNTTLETLNIGSTTDSTKTKNDIQEPSAVIVYFPKDDNTGQDKPYFVEIIDTSRLESKCNYIIKYIDSLPKLNSSNFHTVMDNERGKTLFGICTDYNTPDWKYRDTVHARKNLDLLLWDIKYLDTCCEKIKKFLIKEPSLIEICIAREASKMEAQ